MDWICPKCALSSLEYDPETKKIRCIMSRCDYCVENIDMEAVEVVFTEDMRYNKPTISAG